MSRRIEIELTSKRSDSEWTWRAAGAKQPKGSLNAKLLYDGASVGDVVKAEADFAIDGITILEVSRPQTKRTEKVARIEVKGPEREFKGVTSQLAPKGRAGGKGARPRRDDKRSERRDDRPDRKPRGDRPPRRERERPTPPTFKRLNPGDEHRQMVLTDIAPEHRPIAEQVLRGGIPAVRQAIEAENAKAKQEGRPEINAPAFISIAEELLPQLKAADWLDRAEAAKKQVDEISVRDLRSVVTGADAVARTDEARLLAVELREALDRRMKEDRENWVKEITAAIDEGRVVRGLRLSARPPDAQSKFPPELLERLKEAAQTAMAPDVPSDRWITMIEAVAASPVRRNVEPVGLPTEPTEALLTAAKQAAGRIPALAKMLGVTIPPPPTPAKKLPPKPKPSGSATPGSAPAAASSDETPKTEGEAVQPEA